MRRLPPSAIGSEICRLIAIERSTITAMGAGHQRCRMRKPCVNFMRSG